MYHVFFGLKEPAFSIAVNPRYLYMSEQHREALAHLLYGIQNGGFVMLTGEVGTGKTTMIRCLLEQLPDNTDMAIILNPMASAPELLSTICDELGVSYISDELTIKNLTDSLNTYLLENHRKGRKTVLLIDEAQLLKVPVLEQIRLLTNLETTTEKLLQIILVGQPELKKLLARPALRQLSQRITARFHLEALTLADTQAYIAHRLHVAGMNPGLKPFPSTIIKKIHEFSGGIPRLINVLCERLLLGAYGKNLHQVDMQVFAMAVKEITGAQFEPARTHASGSRIWALAAAILLVAAALWYLVPQPAPQMSAVADANELVAAPPQASASASSAAAVLAAEVAAASASSAAASEVFNYGWREQNQAQLGLLDYLGLEGSSPDNPCALRDRQTLVCEKMHVGSWNELRDINRPALLTLVTAEKKWVYLLVTGLGEDRVRVHFRGVDEELPWRDLAELWNGDLLYIWSRPADFDKSLALGDKGELVTWVAEQFARLDKQPAPLTRQYFNDKLEKRVELFQSSQRMVPDGIFGVQTLRRLNEALGVDKVLVDLDAQAAIAGSAGPRDVN